MKNVLITGITGQDGSYLAELYLNDGWNVHGIVRRSSSLSRPRIDHLSSPKLEGGIQKIKLHYGDLSDVSALIRIIQEVEPIHLINLAAQSDVAVSFEVPMETANISGLGAAAVFEAVRIVNPDIKVYQASSSEMYGGGQGSTLLNENSTFDPKSPYAAAKLYAYNMAKIYRNSYGMHISNGILFNHESPRRGENFVSRKITKAVAAIKLGHQQKLYLGNISATRDWGHARDYMVAVKKMLEAGSADDFVVATGTSHSVLEFANLAFKTVDLDASNFIEVDPKFFRPNEVQDLRGNASKIYSKLGWEPQITFENLIEEMVTSDLNNLEK